MLTKTLGFMKKPFEEPWHCIHFVGVFCRFAKKPSLKECINLYCVLQFIDLLTRFIVRHTKLHRLNKINY